ncbi:ankyrin repeat-containing domain protein, partial [Boletus edulis]
SAGATEVVRYLIDQGTDVTKVDGIGWAALHIAASAGHEEIVHELIGAGADVNQRNDKGITPLCDIS